MTGSHIHAGRVAANSPIAGDEYFAKLAEGSENLLRALRTGKARSTKLVWSLRGHSHAPHSYPLAAISLAQKEAMRDRVVLRDPCFRCGTRADLGCACR